MLLVMTGGHADTQTHAPRSRFDRNLAMAVLAIPCIALAWMLDGWTTAACIFLVILCGWQGLKLGAIEIGAVLLSTLLALFISGPLGRMIEPGIAAMTGLGGLLNRAVSFAIVAIGTVAIGGVGGRLIVRALLAENSRWRARNSLVGGLLGVIEGFCLWLGLVWVILALRPVAQARLAVEPDAPKDRIRYIRQREPISAAVVGIADAIERSRFGEAAEEANPVPSLQILMLAEAFSAVSRDDYAMRWFLDSKVMRDIRALPSYNRAVTLASGDSRLTEFFSNEGVESGLLIELMRNETIVEIIDSTTIAADLGPLAERLEMTIHDARARIGQGRPEDIDIE
jgi:hypothetical protein